MLDVFGKKIIVKILGGLVIFQICQGIIIPIKEQPRPAYTSGIKTARRPDSPYTLQNYSRVIVHNRPDIDGAQYVITKTDQVKSVYPVFNPNTNRENYQNILQTQSHTKIDAGEASRTNRTIIKRKIEAKTLDIYTKCPSGATGQFIYSASCNQFLNCWKGRGTVQNCAPGTLFNPKSLECDFPDKVECVTGPRSNTVENIRVQKSIQQATCPEGFSGIIPDYFDCSKFINCNNGQENKMDCAPGTLFDINKNMCDYPHQTTCFNGENTLNAKTTLLNCNSATHCDLSSNYEQSEHDQTGSVFNQRPVYNQGQYQYSTSKNGQSGTNLNGGNSYSQSNTVTQGCNPSTQNCEQFSGQRPIYNQGQNQYSTSNNGYSGTDLSGGNSYSQSHNVVAQRCNPATQNCGKISGQRPIYNHGQNQYQTTADGQSGTDLSGDNSYSQSHTVTQRCNPSTQNCEQFSGQRPIYNQGQNQYSTSNNGYSGTDLSGGNSYSQSHNVVAQRCNPATQNCGKISGQRPIYNHGQNQYQTTADGQSGTDLSGDNSYSQSHTVTQRCNPATQNCGQISGQRPIYNHGQNQYQTTADGQSGTDLSGGNYYNQSHIVTQGCNPATQNCGQISGQRPIYNQGQNQYQTTDNGQSGTDLSADNSYSQFHNIVTQRCNPATQNCGQISGQRPIYNHGQNQYQTTADGHSGTDLSGGNYYSQSHTVTQGCNPATQNCGQISGQRPIYNQGQNQYQTTANGQSGTDLSGDNSYSQTHNIVTQRCNPATQNCGQTSGQKPIYNQGQNQYTTSTDGQSGTDLSGSNSYSQSHIVTQGCNPVTQNCGQISGQRPIYNQGQNQYQTTANEHSGTDLSGDNSYSQSHTVTQECNPATQNCEQFSRQKPTYYQGQKLHTNNGQSQTNYHTDTSQYGQTGQNGVFNCDLSKPNCGHTQQPNYGKVCNVNDPNCGKNQWATQKPVTNRPAVNSQPICPNDSVGLHKHPTDCKKYLNCGSGQTFVMDCAAGTLFNEKTGMCDFPSNVQCVVSEIVEEKETGGGSFDESWQIQYENNKQKFGQNAGHGNIRYTTEITEVDNQLPSENKGQQTVGDNSRGSTGYVKRLNVKNTPLDYEDVYNPDNNILTGTTPRSAWPPPYQTEDTNELGETDYIFTYDNGDPVVLEPDNVIEVKERVAIKSCDGESFHCSPKYCVPLTTLCDGVRDCSDGKDELNCQEYTDRFITTKNSKLVVPENQRYINITHSTCAVLCIQNRKFTCRSFTYRRPDRTCFLSDKNIGMSGALQAYQSSDYYELKAGSIDCSDTSKYFECNNKKCLTKDHLCDGYTDCEDREDEKHCGPEKFGYKVKLVGSNDKNSGRVEVTAFNSTGYICDDDFSIVDANVICRELGFALGAAEIKGQSQFAKDLKESNTLYMIDDLNCIGNESSLIDCSFPGWGIHNCRDQEIAGIVCKTPQEKCGDDAWKCDSGNECIPFDFVCDGVDDCADESDEAVQHCESPTDLRLVDGSYPGEGRLEIKHNGIWGTVCDDDFNEDAAKVVCKFLGYKGHSYVKKDGYFGAGYGPIWLDQVSCFGNETELNKCTHWNWGEHNCEHSEDVGIICSQDVGEVKIERHSNLQSRIEEGLPRNCGFRKDNQFAINDLIQARVIGGGVAQKGDYPWQAALKVRVKEKSAHWCGAIIISSKWVLTAAHCLQGYTKGAYIIVAGEYDTNENEGTEQQKYIDEFFIHEKFRKGHKLNNDIALIKVKSSGFELNDDVQPICLADADTDYNRKLNCTISGFGSVKSGSSSVSHNLLAAWIPIHSQDICKMEHVYGNILTDGMFCAGSMDGGLDACDGDSGGPLACLDQGVFTLYGITSWGQHCGYANKPGVYVKVGHYKKWIEEIIAKHSN